MNYETKKQTVIVEPYYVTRYDNSQAYYRRPYYQRRYYSPWWGLWMRLKLVAIVAIATLVVIVEGLKLLIMILG